MTTDYDSQAKEWAGDKPKHLSDWIARPVVLNRIKKIGKEKIVLDIGCGTGYFSRKMAPYVGKVIAFESAKKMLEEAQAAEDHNPLGIEYKEGDMRNMQFLDPQSVDICILNFVLPYIHPDEYKEVFRGVGRVLKPGGKFFIIQGHPYLHYLAPNHKKSKNTTRGEYVEFELPKAGGGFVTVGQYNFTFEDLFNHCLENDLAYQQIQELKVLDVPQELGAIEGEIPYIYLEGIKLPSY